MSEGWAYVNGELLPIGQAAIPLLDVAVTRGWTAFDTFLASDGKLIRFEEHLQRLVRSAESCMVPMPEAAVLAKEALHLAELIPGTVRIRITLSGSGWRATSGIPTDLSSRFRGPVDAARGVHRDEPYLGGAAKHGCRIGWMVACERTEADEVLLVDSAGRFTEGTTCAVLTSIEGELWTAPHDGRILASTACLAVLQRAEQLGIPIIRQGALAAGPWDALYVCSTTRGLARVASLDGETQPEICSLGQQLYDSEPKQNYHF